MDLDEGVEVGEVVNDRIAVSKEISAIESGEYSGVVIQKTLEKGLGFGDKVGGLRGGEFLIGWIKEVVLEATADIFVTFHKNRTKVFVGRYDNKVWVLTKLGKETALQWGQVAGDFLFYKPRTYGVCKVFVPIDEFRCNVAGVREPFGVWNV